MLTNQKRVFTCHHARDDLGDVGNSFDSQRFEYEDDSLDYTGVMLTEGGVSDDPHESSNGNTGVEIIQRQVRVRDEHLTGGYVLVFVLLIVDRNQRSRLGAPGVNLTQVHPVFVRIKSSQQSQQS